jgi:uncharacterized oligopeptide transporter (OPT) family protein
VHLVAALREQGKLPSGEPQFALGLSLGSLTTGIGLGLILPFLNPLSMFVGSVAAWAWERGNKQSSDDYMIPVASGVIAGISIIGVLAAFVNNVFLAG